MSYIVFLDLTLFFNDSATTEIHTYRPTLSLPDALPIPTLPTCAAARRRCPPAGPAQAAEGRGAAGTADCASAAVPRSALEDRREPLPAADAHRLEPITNIAAAHLVEHRRSDAHARHTDRMTERKDRKSPRLNSSH